jgi:hypothetical protein
MQPMNVTVFSETLGRTEQRPFDWFGALDEGEGTLMDEHSFANYGLPVVVSKVSGRAYGPSDLRGAVLSVPSMGITVDELLRARQAGWQITVGP